MPKSIRQGQEEFLKSSFNKKLKGNKENFTEVEIGKDLIGLAATIIAKAAENLDKKNRIASGALTSSMKITEPKIEGSKVSCEITLLDYWKFVDKGVKGTKGGASKEGYSFKSDMPSKKMVTAIQGWLTEARGKATSVKRSYKAEKKSLSESATAFAVARSIKMKGLKSSNFLTDAVKEGRRESKKMGLKIKVDV
jgi:hypothetical protein